MGGIFQPLVDLAGGFLGQTNAQYNAKTQGANANQYGGQAAQGYKNLQGMGQNATSPYGNNYNNIFSTLATGNGLNWLTALGPNQAQGTAGRECGRLQSRPGASRTRKRR
jgi:hypothetical protein